MKAFYKKLKGGDMWMRWQREEKALFPREIREGTEWNLFFL